MKPGYLNPYHSKRKWERLLLLGRLDRSSTLRKAVMDPLNELLCTSVAWRSFLIVEAG